MGTKGKTDITLSNPLFIMSKRKMDHCGDGVRVNFRKQVEVRRQRQTALNECIDAIASGGDICKELNDKLERLVSDFWPTFDWFPEDKQRQEKVHDMTEIVWKAAIHESRDDIICVVFRFIPDEDQVEVINGVLGRLAQTGNKQELKSFCESCHCTSKHVQHTYANESNLLHVAAAKGNIEALEYLLEGHFGEGDLRVVDERHPFCTPVEVCIWELLYTKDMKDTKDTKCARFLLNKTSDKFNRAILHKVVGNLREANDAPGIATAEFIEEEFRNMF